MERRVPGTNTAEGWWQRWFMLIATTRRRVADARLARVTQIAEVRQAQRDTAELSVTAINRLRLANRRTAGKDGDDRQPPMRA